MPKINVRPTAEAVTVKLEGVLVGPWVDELECCFDQAQATRQDRPLRVDVTGLTHINHDGKQLLNSMQRDGAVFVTDKSSNNRFLDELKRRSLGRRFVRRDLNKRRPK